MDSIELKLTLKGLTRISSHLPKKALPITPEILRDMFAFLNMDSLIDKVYWALFLIAFFMMSRKSNLVPVSIAKFDKNKQLLRKDILIEENLLIILVKWSKTIQFGERVLRIPIVSIPNSILCPVAAYKNMISAIPASHSAPAFCKILGDKRVPITYLEFQNKLKYLIGCTGRNPASYSTHSFRRGGASLAFKSDVPSELIQMHGDWRSDAYKKYLEFTLEQKLLVSKKIRELILSDK